MPPFRKACFLAGLGIERLEFLQRGADVFRLPLGSRHGRAKPIGFLLELPQAPAGGSDVARLRLQPPESVEQAAMFFAPDQSAVVMLPVNLDQHGADLAQEGDAA